MLTVASTPFRSFVCGQDDANALVTGLALRALRPLMPGARDGTSLAADRDRALDFLETCQSRELPGAFRFWPSGRLPAWANEIPDDADDTAICALELVHYGRRPASFLAEVAYHVLIHRRVRFIDQPAPVWLRQGAFLTWLSPEPRANVVDCCVNANVVATLASAGLGHLPGYRQACEMIQAAIEWAGNSLPRFRSITPFYPHPAELALALDHAVGCGAVELRDASSVLREKLPSWPTNDLTPVCSRAYGGIIWTAPALHRARCLALGRSTEVFV
jgi:hypothetical protein